MENHACLQEAALWVSMAEPSHLDHTPTILKRCGFHLSGRCGLLWELHFQPPWAAVAVSHLSQACCLGCFHNVTEGGLSICSALCQKGGNPGLKQSVCGVMQPEETNSEPPLKLDINALLKHDFAWCSSRPMWKFLCLG